MANRSLMLVAVVLAFLAGTFLFVAYRPDLSTLRQLIGSLGGWRDDYPLTTAVVFFAIFIATTALSLPLGMWLSLSAGALFGFPSGTVLAVAASTIGATLAMAGSRYLFRDRLNQWLQGRQETQKRRWLSAVHRGFARDGWLYLLSLRMLPIIPFFIINLAMGLTAMSVRVFFFVTLVGILPLTSIFVWTGTRLARVQRPIDLISGELIASLALLAALPWVTRFFISALRSTPPTSGPWS